MEKEQNAHFYFSSFSCYVVTMRLILSVNRFEHQRTFRDERHSGSAAERGQENIPAGN
jgi:hypothetical protein